MKITKLICEDCKIRASAVNFSDEPMYSMTHRFGIIHLCRGCYIKRIEQSLIKTKENLKLQKDLLKKENEMPKL